MNGESVLVNMTSSGRCTQKSYGSVKKMCIRDRDEIILVEVQNTRELYYLERILYGVAKAITEHIDLSLIHI